jgi:hypothetical protein
MNLKLIFLLFFLFIFVKTQELENTDQEDSCYYIYNCCKKLDNDCVEYCEPIVVCGENATNDITGHENVIDTGLIAVACRKGFR